MEVQSHEASYCITVVYRVLHHRIRQVEPRLNQVHTQHDLYSPGGTTPVTPGVEGTNEVNPFGPGDDFIHHLQEALPLRDALAPGIFKIAEAALSRHG